MGFEIIESKFDYIIQLTKQLNEDLKEYIRNEGRLPEEEEKLQKLNNEIERFCKNISQNLCRYKNKDLKDKMKDMRLEGRKIQIIRNPQIVEEKFENLKIQWKEFLKDTKDIRKGLKTQEEQVNIEKRVIDTEN